MFTLNGIRYKDILLIDELQIPGNKTTCIIGESGSGKTTLLRLLNNLISADEGSIFFEGKNIDDIEPVELRRKVAMLPQVPAIFSGTVRDNLNIGLKFSEKPIASDEELIKIMKLAQLDKELTDNAEKLSGGEKQRLALARVLLLHPEVLLLDEPSSALDEDTERIVIENVVGYAKSNNKTLIMVTHSKDIAKSFGDNIVEISRGRVAR